METIQASAGLPTFRAPIIPTPGASDPSQRPMITRSRYLAVLGVMFSLFSSARVIAYLPTIWAVVTTGHSSQHSLWTWCCWFGANLTMAGWLYEQNCRRCDRVVVLNAGNALMCAATIVLIVFYRLGQG